MAQATEQRRDDLRKRLIDLAEARIAVSGLPAVRARDLAREAGCSVGAIYNVFTDLNGLIMAVNGRTFRRLGAHVSAALEGTDAGPQQRLVIMGHAYLGFAAANTRVWRALFDLQMSTDMDVPDWYLKELRDVFALIAAPLRDLFPDWDTSRIDLMTRALFSSVHGIVLLGLERRISGVEAHRMGDMIRFVIGAAART